VLLSGCSRSTAKRNASPEKLYQESFLKVNRGELLDALLGAETGLHDFPSPDSKWYWEFTVLKAEILLQQHHTKEALALLEPSPPQSLEDTDLAVRRKMTQGIAQGYLLEFGAAERLLGEAESIASKGQPGLLGEVFLRKGTLAFLRNKNAAAESAYRTTLRIAQQEKDSFLEAAALGSLGLVATKQEHYDESIDWNSAALEKSRVVGAKSSVARILGNTGWSYFELGEYENALALFQQAEKAAEQIGLERLEIDSLLNIGNVHSEQREYETARQAYLEVLPLATRIGHKTAVTECYTNLALLDLEANQFESAQRNEEKLSEFVEQYPNDSLAMDSKLIQGRIGEAGKDYSTAEKLFRSVIGNKRATTSQKWQAQARLAETFALEHRNTDADREYRAALETIEKARTSLLEEGLRLSFLSNPISSYSDYIDFLMSQHRTVDALQVAEQSRARTLEEGLATTAQPASLSTRGVHPQEIARKLKGTLLFYWIGQKNAYLWVITPTKTDYFKLPPASEIEPLVKSYRKATLEMRDAQGTGSAGGQKLYSMLVEPAKKLIPPGSRVILLPDASLYGLNFETLIVPGPQPHFWIEDVTLTTASSLTLLGSSLMHAKRKGNTLLLIGNTQAMISEFPALAQAPAEMEKIESHFLEDYHKVLEGSQATPKAYLGSHPEQYSYIHFVTHGTASSTRPLESAVILSPEGDSYKLYARDIVQHRLNANLVTISACNGSGTRTYSGEGLVGLSWAFLHAGAHNVIGALWEVSDASTPQLMDALYGELTQGKDPATALRDAKLSLLHSSDTNSVFKKPFYWAPFQLYAGS
jgi:CHAT domain-containing protein